jgi:hypothetical protein
MNTAWVIFSGNPDYNHDYDISPENLRKQAEDPPGFIRLLDDDAEMRMKEELKEEEEHKTAESASFDESSIPRWQRKGVANVADLKKPDSRYKPIACSSRAFSFHESEKATIDNLRQWAYDYFRSTEIFDSATYMMEKE